LPAKRRIAARGEGQAAIDNPATVGPRSDCGVTIDAVEEALATALAEASAGGRWDVVAQLARELEARRSAREAPNVVILGNERRQR